MARTYPPPSTKKPHVIAEISFRKDRVVCTCGFRGTNAEYDAHRREFGRKK